MQTNTRCVGYHRHCIHQRPPASSGVCVCVCVCVFVRARARVLASVCVCASVYDVM